MKKISLIILLLLACTYFSFSQSESNALGLRFGMGHNVGTEISFQRFIGDANRLELDLGWRFSGSDETGDYLTFTGIYQFVFDLNGSFYAYAGPGAAVAFSSNNPEGSSGDVILYGAGQVGIEYNFDFPIQVGLDIRPLITILPNLGDFYWDLALSFRFRF